MKKTLRITAAVLGGLVGLLVLFLAGLVIFGQLSYKQAYNRPVYELAADTSPAGVARGEYLVRHVMACADCHAGGRDANLSGVTHPVQQGPVGGIFSGSNLTPDPETGLGAWTDGEIARAIREGVDREGVELVVMPSLNYKSMSDKDVAAIVGYLRSLDPVRKELPPFIMNVPAKTLWALGLMGGPMVREPITTRQENPAPGSREYGEYLVNLGGCRDCHGPDLTGGMVPMAPPGSPPGTDITPAGALSGWSEAEFARAMRQGRRPDGQIINPLMPWETYSGMSDEDLASMYAYLGSLNR